MRFLAPFSMSVELLGEEADALALGLGGVGKWEGLEAAGLDVDGVVSEAEPASGCECPCDVNAAGEDTEHESVAGCDVDELVVRQNGRIEEDEESVLGGFDSRDVAAEASQSGAKVRCSAHRKSTNCRVRLARLFSIPFRLHMIHDVLIHGGKSFAHLLGRQPEQVNHHDAAGT